MVIMAFLVELNLMHAQDAEREDETQQRKRGLKHFRGQLADGQEVALLAQCALYIPCSVC